MPCNYKEYPENWKEIVSTLKHKVGHKCELCHARNYEPHWHTNSKVILTVHHIDFDKKNNTYPNLIVLCQRCHLRLDLAKHLGNRRAKANNKNKQNRLF